MKKPSRPIVVSCPKFSENSGGAIVLHFLVHRLRMLGVDAFAAPMTRGQKKGAPSLRYARNFLRKKRYDFGFKRFITHPSMNVPIAHSSLWPEAIAVYPEVVEGNPIGARHVVRWILYQPGFFKSGPDTEELSRTVATGDEEIFVYQPVFGQNIKGLDPKNVLRLAWMREDLYFDRGFKERKGSCRLIRKGTNQKYIPSLEEDDAVRIDGLSHKETAEIFNRCETFHCHDPYTAYSVFAVFCGCTTIVYPETGVSEADWRPIEERWGIAYGNSPEQIAFAQSTRHKMRETRARLQAEEDEQLRYFVTRLAERFD